MQTFWAKWIPLLTLLNGCAHDLNRVNAQRYYDVGLRAESARDWPAAKEAYRRALINARLAQAPQDGISATTYNLGRMTGYTCDFAEAENLLREALQLEQTLPSPDVSNVTKRLSELARISFDQGKFQESASYYERSVPELEKLNVLNIDPMGYAIYLEDYATALDRSGNTNKATQIRKRAESIRSNNTGKSAKFIPLHYRDICGKKP
jgi:tetratricopeptide (TPR) repeat protein